jgi:hypothetical protein
MHSGENRLTRILATTVTLLSTAAVVCSLLFWIRSYDRKEYFTLYIAPNQYIEFFTANGRFFWEHTAMIDRHPGAPAWVPLRVSGDSSPRGDGDGPHPTPDFLLFRFAKWSYLFEDDDGLVSQHIIGTPAWFVTGVTSLPVLFALRRFLRRRYRVRNALCVACGYDLRGTPDQCPECGTASVSAAGSWSSRSGIPLRPTAPETSEAVPNTQSTA